MFLNIHCESVFSGLKGTNGVPGQDGFPGTQGPRSVPLKIFLLSAPKCSVCILTGENKVKLVHQGLPAQLDP